MITRVLVQAGALQPDPLVLLTLFLALQIEPMTRDIAVIMPDVEEVGIFPRRTGHRDGLLAVFTAAQA